jgi:hypothetical protein
MSTVVPGRLTHDHDGEVVVFLIGFRINRLWAVRSWWPVARAMGPMLRELSADPSLGLLGFTNHLSPRGALVVQYWRDLDSLIGYARSADHVHRPAWAEFNRRARAAAGAAGIWHETYVVPAGRHESLYVDMPSTGLAAAVGAVEASGRRESARGRFGAAPAPQAPAEPSAKAT